ncbi:hypothetical protein SAMN06298216_1848 [Spirosomataceae bacterium TFI 002]|nr:hypothetical protein SAMN06298216_1848 [Spirosomataceae bacterium TFI 002]
MTKIESKQFTKDQINDYLDGKMDGDQLLEFETEIFTSTHLEKEVAMEVLQRMRNQHSEPQMKTINKGVVEDKPNLSTNTRTKQKSCFDKYFNFLSSN